MGSRRFVSNLARTLAGILFVGSVFSWSANYALAATMSPIVGKCEEIKITITQTDLNDNFYFFVKAGDKSLAATNGADYEQPSYADYGFTHALCGHTNWWFKLGGSTLPNGNYILIVWGPPYDFVCDDLDSDFDYSACKTTASYVTEIAFTVGGSGPTSFIGGREEHFPVAQIISKLKGKIFSATVPVEYLVTDEDEVRAPEYGLRATNPAEFFLGKPHGPYGDVDWELLARLPATGTFMWDTAKIPDGRYRLKLKGWDAVGNADAKETGDFTLDNTPPQFKININPTFTRGEPINIEVESLELLAGIPKLTVAQLNHEAIDVPLVGEVSEGTFHGAYTPVKGFDGPATIAVEGKDLAGNTSTIIIGAKHFSVGTAPPVAPLVELPKDGMRTAASTTTLVGRVSHTVRVAAHVNGKTTYKQEDLRDGNFRIEGIQLDPNFHKGENSISVVAYDAGGNISEPTVVTVFVNSPPSVKLLEPLGRRLKFKDRVTVRWEARDINEDSLVYAVELSNNRGTSWKTIAEKVRTLEFPWDTTTVPDGANYMLRITASDGSLAASAVGPIFTVENNLPTLILDTSGELFTSEAARLFTGAVRSKNDPLVKLESSVDGGKTWGVVTPDDGAWDAAFERFSFRVPFGRSGAKYTILIRGTTASGRTVANAERLTVFFDNASPTVQPKNLPKEVVKNPFLGVSGLAFDDLSGIETVEYRIDESPWYRGTVEGDPGSRTAQFTIAHPTRLPDGTHEVGIRATDRARNVSAVKNQTLSIDATPPRVGSFTLRSGGTSEMAPGPLLFPADDGAFHVPPQTDIALQAAMFGDPKKVELFWGGERVDIAFDEETGLWSARFRQEKSEETVLKIFVRDAVHNTAEKVLARITPEPISPKTPRPTGVWQTIIEFLKRIL